MQVSHEKNLSGKDRALRAATDPSGDNKIFGPKRLTNQSVLIHQNSTALVSRLLRLWDIEQSYGHLFLWIPIGLICGVIFNYSRSNDISDMAIIGLIFVLVLPILFGHRVIGQTARHLFIFALCGAVGMLLVNIEMKRAGLLLDQAVTTDIKGTVLSHEVDENDIIRYVIALDSTQNPIIRRPPARIQLVARSAHNRLMIGDTIAGRARLTPPSGPVFPGGFDFAFHALSQHIGAYGYFMGKPENIKTKSATHLVPEMSGKSTYKLSASLQWQIPINQLRTAISYRIKRILDGDQAAVASALTVAERKAISTETVDALRQSGLAHILAISGLHMVLAAGTLFVTIRMALVSLPGLGQMLAVKKIAAAGAILTATFYLCISGAPISAQRAWIMLVIILCAVLMDRPALTLRNVALAAIIIIIIKPSAVLTPGFQMSFAAASALVSVYQGWIQLKDHQDRTSLSGFVQSVLSKTAYMMIGFAITAIVAGLASGIFSIQHFYKVASFGVLANVLAMPIVTFMIMPLALLSLLLMPFGLEAWSLVGLGIAIEQVINIATFVADLSGDIRVGKPSEIACWFLILGFVSFICFKSALRYSGLALMAAGLCLVWAKPLQSPDILISEDGRLAAIMSEGEIRVSRPRPSDFIVSQWENAYKVERMVAIYPLSRSQSNNLLSLSADDFWPELNQRIRPTAHQSFQCLDVHFCFYRMDDSERPLTIITIGKPDYLQFACQPNQRQEEQIWVLAFRLYDTNLNCQTKPLVVLDQNSLRRTGAVAINIAPDINDQRKYAFNLNTAIKNYTRPWTIQRYYDWRFRRYQLPSGEVRFLALQNKS